MAATPGKATRLRSGTSSLSPLRQLTLAALAAVTCAVFAGVLRNGWILLDDPPLVYANPHIRHGLRLDQILWFLTHPHGANWHPLTSWSHMLDAQLFGSSPVGPHAVNLGLHALSAVLLVLVWFRMSGAWWRSLLVGALFALHPLRVESVAWISERKDVLSGLFFLLTIAAYQRWTARPGAVRFGLLIATYALGLMTKPMLVTVPFVLVLLDLWPLRRAGDARRAGGGATGRGLARCLAEKWPLFALAALSSAVTFLVQRREGAMTLLAATPWSERVLNAAISCWRYVGMSLWPARLAVFYPTTGTPQILPALAAVAGLLLATGFAIAQRARRPYLAVGWLWYLGMLVPVLGLIQVGGQACADRYTYLPAIGLAIALAWAAGEWADGSRPRRIVVAGAGALALIGLSAATVRQVGLWKDTATLFTHALAVTRDNPVAHEELAGTLLQQGRAREALPHLEEAIRLVPGYLDARAKLGDALGMLGRYEEAAAQFRWVLGARESAELRHNLGYARERQGRLDEAIAEYEAALRLDPEQRISLAHLAAALAARGRFGEAEGRLRGALARAPGDIEVRRQLAAMLVRQDRVEEAIREYDELLRASPGDLDALNNVAWIRATHADAAHRDGAAAVRLAERACALSPEPVAVLEATRAAAYAEAGRFADATRAGERAVALARQAGATDEADAYARQLERYRAGRPFHFGS